MKNIMMATSGSNYRTVSPREEADDDQLFAKYLAGEKKKKEPVKTKATTTPAQKRRILESFED
jgi:hypothetical protein